MQELSLQWDLFPGPHSVLCPAVQDWNTTVPSHLWDQSCCCSAPHLQDSQSRLWFTITGEVLLFLFVLPSRCQAQALTDHHHDCTAAALWLTTMVLNCNSVPPYLCSLPPQALCCGFDYSPSPGCAHAALCLISGVLNCNFHLLSLCLSCCCCSATGPPGLESECWPPIPRACCCCTLPLTPLTQAATQGLCHCHSSSQHPVICVTTVSTRDQDSCTLLYLRNQHHHCNKFICALGSRHWGSSVCAWSQDPAGTTPFQGAGPGLNVLGQNILQQARKENWKTPAAVTSENYRNPTCHCHPQNLQSLGQRRPFMIVINTGLSWWSFVETTLICLPRIQKCYIPLSQHLHNHLPVKIFPHWSQSEQSGRVDCSLKYAETTPSRKIHEKANKQRKSR